MAGVGSHSSGDWVAQAIKQRPTCDLVKILELRRESMGNIVGDSMVIQWDFIGFVMVSLWHFMVIEWDLP